MAPNGNVWAADYSANNNPIVAPSGTIKIVDTGVAGAIFGIATTVSNGSQYVYFNDDNTNTVVRVSPQRSRRFVTRASASDCNPSPIAF